MTAEQIERNRAFLADLRANEKKAKYRMRDEDGGRCCLGVALDTALGLGIKISHAPSDYTHMPPESMAEFYGWDSCSVMIFHGGVDHAPQAWNDGHSGAKELTHAQIADAFEETFPELKEGKP